MRHSTVDKGHYYSLIRSAADVCMGNPMLSASTDSDCVMRSERLTGRGPTNLFCEYRPSKSNMMSSSSSSTFTLSVYLALEVSGSSNYLAYVKARIDYIKKAKQNASGLMPK